MSDVASDYVCFPELFPPYVSLACMRVQEASLDVLEAELPLIKNAVEKRRREFSAGRNCARQALRALGCADTPILHDQNRAPLWPPGIVGSITHSNTHAAAVAAENSKLCGLGIDMEIISRVSPAITRKILTTSEKRYLQQQKETAKQHLRALFFSAKEAIYKCLHPLLQCRIGFEDARIECEPDQRSIKIYMCSRIQSMLPGVKCLQGRYCYFDDTVCSAVWLETKT